jgi:hypothetical protein
LSNIITRSYSGARDLYNGIPNLKNSTVVDVIYEKDSEDYKTILIFKDVKGNEHSIIIKQA